tara:strand:+ start:115 stop:696 length:582 start_codon:yes stop_codon:yes gene_type:complete
MNIENVKLSKVKSNPNNPRLIKDDKFKKLVNSIREFPEMLKIRPIVVNEDMIVLGGNMRLKACKEAGLAEVFIIKASELTEEQQKEFIIKDNAGFGEWDWDTIANEWDSAALIEWGLDVWNPETEIDYSILDDEDLETELSEMTSGVKKAIQIEFDLEHYEEASELVKYWREQDAYIGAMIIEKLKDEKNKSK